MTCGLVLAAGRGSRFGPGPKMLASVAGRPLLEHALRAPCAVAELERVVVVLGAAAQKVLAQVELGRAEAVVCGDWREGQAASLRCGVRELAGAERVLVTLGDQPLVTPEVIRRVLQAGAGARAVYAGEPGHPAVLGPAQLRRVEQLRGDVGARDLLDGPRVECADLARGVDIDTPADLEVVRCEARAVL